MRTLKQISIALILTVGMILSSNAQIIKAPVKPPQIFESFCGTPAFMNQTNIQLMQSGSSSGFYDLSNASACVKLYFHIIRSSNGTGGVSTANINQSLNILNNDFNDGDIFFSWDGQIDYINNSTIYNANNISTLSTVFNINNHTDGVDIYINHDAGYPAGRANGVGESSELVISGSFSVTPLSRSHVLSHELGHVFGLWHTHHGTYNEGGNDNPCPELVNGSNSHICGDYVIDTPADPHIHFNVNSSCQWLGSGTDANGQSYNPDEQNIMAYTTPICMDYFTNKQRDRMLVAMINLPHLQNVANVSLYPLQSGQNICNGLITLDVIISPNPVNRILNININDGFNSNNYKIGIFNQFNNQLYSNIFKNTNYSVDISTLPNGVYFVLIENNITSIVKTLVINH